MDGCFAPLTHGTIAPHQTRKIALNWSYSSKESVRLHAWGTRPTNHRRIPAQLLFAQPTLRLKLMPL